MRAGAGRQRRGRIGALQISWLLLVTTLPVIAVNGTDSRRNRKAAKLFAATILPALTGEILQWDGHFYVVRWYIQLKLWKFLQKERSYVESYCTQQTVVERERKRERERSEIKFKLSEYTFKPLTFVIVPGSPPHKCTFFFFWFLYNQY